jgi:hypothetical protein
MSVASDRMGSLPVIWVVRLERHMDVDGVGIASDVSESGKRGPLP